MVFVFIIIDIQKITQKEAISLPHPQTLFLIRVLLTYALRVYIIKPF